MTPTPGTTRRRRDRRRAALVAGVVTIVLITVAAVWMATRPADEPTADPSAVMRASAQLADAHAGEPVPEGAESYLRTETTRPFSARGWSYSVTTVRTARVDAMNESRTDVDANEPAFTSRDDWRAWRAAGSPTLPGMEPGPSTIIEPATVPVAGRDVPLAEADAELNHDPHTLRGILAKSDPAGDAFTGGVRILLSPGLPPHAQASVWRALATVDGTSLSSRDRQRATPDGPADVRHHVLERPGGLSVTVDDRTGRLTGVRGLDGARITVGAVGVVNCLDLTGPGGPAEIYVGCATGGFIIRDLAWDETWGGPEAFGEGVADVKDCDPDCATGRTTTHPVRVRFSEQAECGFNLRLYTRLDITFTDSVPPNGERVVTEHFRCNAR